MRQKNISFVIFWPQSVVINIRNLMYNNAKRWGKITNKTETQKKSKTKIPNKNQKQKPKTKTQIKKLKQKTKTK